MKPGIGLSAALTIVFFLANADAQSPRRVIIDTDPGIDDAMAILLALNSPELKVEALTVVAGNVEAWQGLRIVGGPLRCARRCRSPTSAEPEVNHSPVLARQERIGRHRVASKQVQGGFALRARSHH